MYPFPCDDDDEGIWKVTVWTQQNSGTIEVILPCNNSKGRYKSRICDVSTRKWTVLDTSMCVSEQLEAVVNNPNATLQDLRDKLALSNGDLGVVDLRNTVRVLESILNRTNCADPTLERLTLAELSLEILDIFLTSGLPLFKSSLVDALNRFMFCVLTGVPVNGELADTQTNVNMKAGKAGGAPNAVTVDDDDVELRVELPAGCEYVSRVYNHAGDRYLPANPGGRANGLPRAAYISPVLSLSVTDQCVNASNNDLQFSLIFRITPLLLSNLPEDVRPKPGSEACSLYDDGWKQSSGRDFCRQQGECSATQLKAGQCFCECLLSPKKDFNFAILVTLGRVSAAPNLRDATRALISLSVAAMIVTFLTYILNRDLMKQVLTRGPKKKTQKKTKEKKQERIIRLPGGVTCELVAV